MLPYHCHGVRISVCHDRANDMSPAKRTAKRESAQPTAANQAVAYGLSKELADQRRPRNTECACIQLDHRGKVLPFQSPDYRLLRCRNKVGRPAGNALALVYGPYRLKTERMVKAAGGPRRIEP
ncbi:hypothetical protein D9M72_573690 [compost metagenome]